MSTKYDHMVFLHAARCMVNLIAGASTSGLTAGTISANTTRSGFL